MSNTFEVRINAINTEAQGILSYEFVPVSGGELPAFAAGAHVDLQLPGGMVRSYSLLNSQNERHRYVIAVALDSKTRGGSKYIQEQLKVGDVLHISRPKNNFPVAEDAAKSLLIAGGIGITPLWCMIQRLQDLSRPWELYYCVRTREQAALLAPLKAAGEGGQGIVHFNFDHESGGKLLDLGPVIAAQPPGTHMYCCGPLPMLAAFESAAAALPSQEIHVEYFSAKDAPASEGGFTVVLAKSGKEVFVPAGKAILDTILDLGIDTPYSCMEGTCGECVTDVLEGVPDHRDVFLTKQDQAANKKMMICCSGSKSARLVLNL
ncbi:MAG: oxidoreductase [Betaproteobacteria bacterium]|nr:oxidoreductase [Betaproteobacteria bacterium]